MNATPTIHQATLADLDTIVDLCCQLWPEATREEHTQGINTILTTNLCGTLPAAIFLAEHNSGFLQIGLRSHADGCDPVQPVGFIEGLYVREESRGKGIARALLHAAETWSRNHGARELASDTWIDHTISIKAHQSLGFKIVDRCVHFRKPL